MNCRSSLILLLALIYEPSQAAELGTTAPRPAANYSAKFVDSLAFGDEFVEVTAVGTLRHRCIVWGDFAEEMAAWKAKADVAAKNRRQPPRTFRLGCIFLKDAKVVFPEVAGTNGQPLQAVYSTPLEFEVEMRTHTTREYADFTWAFSGGEVKCEWVFETLKGLTWTAAGRNPGWGCQPRAIGDQLEKSLAKHKDTRVDMWVYCAGTPETVNGLNKNTVAGPPYGISYTQWTLFGGYAIVVCAPQLPLLVHEVNHRYLDNLPNIEGIQLTTFHGLSLLGYEAGDLGYPDLLAAYRSIYQHFIRRDMWRRFSLTGPHGPRSEPFGGKLYKWSDVGDDCWFRLPLLERPHLAQLTGLPSLQLAADRNSKLRHFTVADSDRSKLLSPYAAAAVENDTALNNTLSLTTESCAVLRTATGHWLVVRPEVADVYVQGIASRGPSDPLPAAGWINEGVRPLLVLRAPPELVTPENEIGYFR
jgi:hypothetical protein